MKGQPMQVYLGARYSRHPEMQHYARDLATHGHRCVARWLLGGHDFRATEMGYVSSDAEDLQAVWAQEDWTDLMAADVAVFFTEAPGEVQGRGRGGRHVELGAAIATGKRVCVVGYRENVFCWLPQVEFYATWPDCLQDVFRLEAQRA